MSDKEEGNLSRSESPAGSLKRTPSPAESGRISRSRSGSVASQKSNASQASKGSRGSRPRMSRSRSRSYRRSYRSRSYSHSPRYSRSRSRSRSRRRYYSRSRSRSPYHSRRRRSYHERRRGYYRSRSRSPMSRRRRHMGSRDNPKESHCVGVFGLSLYTQERDLREVFGRYGPLEDVQVVYDHQTGRSRGFAFVYFRSTADAQEAKERATGTEIDGRRIRVDFSITERAHTPTPGIYLGKPTPRGSRYSRSRSRSRSYSPSMKEE